MGLCFLIAQFLQPVVETIFRDHLSSKFWPALPIHLPFDSISPSFSKNSPCVFQVLGYYLTSLGEMPCGGYCALTLGAQSGRWAAHLWPSASADCKDFIKRNWTPIKIRIVSKLVSSYGGAGGIRTHGTLRFNWFRVFSTIMTFVVFSYRFQDVLSAQNHSCIKVFWHSPLKKAWFFKGFEWKPKMSRFWQFC